MEATIYDFIKQSKAGTVTLTDSGLIFETKSKELPSGAVSSEIVLDNNVIKKVLIDLSSLDTEEEFKKKAQEFLPDGFTMWKNW